jgi:hypothetical protein
MKERVVRADGPSPTKQPPIGTGQRFKALVGQLSSKKGISDPAGLAASIGRKKFGASRFGKMAAAGKAKAAPIEA